MNFSEYKITSKHYIVIFVLSLSLGIFISGMFGFIAATAIGILLVLELLLISATMLLFKNSPKKFVILSILIIISFFLGNLRMYNTQNTISKYKGTEAWVFGRVVTEPSLALNDNSYTFQCDVYQIDDKSANGTIAMYIPSDSKYDFHIGDNIFCWAELYCDDSYNQPLFAEYDIYLKGRNIFLSGNTKSVNIIESSSGKFFSIRSIGDIFQRKISLAIESLFDNNPIFTNILKGIMIGDKSDFSYELNRKFSNSGISHIVAVSGLHISILYLFLTNIFGSFSRRSLWKILVVVPFITLFMAGAGFSHSVCRASIMVFVYILATITRRRYDPITSLFISLGIILAVAPYSIFSRSMVLSFFAVLGILVYFEYIYSAITFSIPTVRIKNNLLQKTLNKIIFYIPSSIALSVSVFIGTAYFLVLFFETISKVQILTNIWIVPLTFVVFVLGYLSCITFSISPWLYNTSLKYPLGLCLKVIEETINHFGKSAFGYDIYFSDNAVIYGAIYYVLALAIYLVLKLISDKKTQKLVNSKNKL